MADHVILELGPLPADAINRTLGHDLESGNVILSVAAQRHALRRHPEEYAKCMPHIASAVSRPDFLGDDFKNHGKIELVVRVPALGGGLLVAVVIEPDGDGNYNVSSFYPVSAAKIENRRQKLHLKPPQWK
jgi:hypothetical protein